jgi:hypothetical protein
MPINLDKALGAQLEPIEFSWSSRGVQLCRLGLDAGADRINPRELRYLTDDTPQVLPTSGSVTASFHQTEPPAVQFPGAQAGARSRRVESVEGAHAPVAPGRVIPGLPSSSQRTRRRAGGAPCHRRTAT